MTKGTWEHTSGLLFSERSHCGMACPRDHGGSGGSANSPKPLLYNFSVSSGSLYNYYYFSCVFLSSLFFCVFLEVSDDESLEELTFNNIHRLRCPPRRHRRRFRRDLASILLIFCGGRPGSLSWPGRRRRRHSTPRRRFGVLTSCFFLTLAPKQHEANRVQPASQSCVLLVFFG